MEVTWPDSKLRAPAAGFYFTLNALFQQHTQWVADGGSQTSSFYTCRCLLGCPARTGGSAADFENGREGGGRFLPTAHMWCYHYCAHVSANLHFSLLQVVVICFWLSLFCFFLTHCVTPPLKRCFFKKTILGKDVIEKNKNWSFHCDALETGQFKQS